MKYRKDITDFCISEETVISLGKFDGIHRGHERLMEYLSREKQKGLKTVIFTFDIPPKKKVKQQEIEKVLTTNEEKMHLFEQLTVSRRRPSMTYGTGRFCRLDRNKTAC